ncbi:MAG: hypothetical protein ACJ796_14545 [Gemmatimonadaceae bacterium]
MSVDLEDFEFAVAERFHRVFPLQAAYSARTSRELAAALAPDAPDLENPVSLTARAFYRIRSWVAEVLDIDPRSLSPSTRWADVLPDGATRRIAWAHLRDLLAIREAPRLHRPRAVTWPIAIVTSAVGLEVIFAVTAMGPAQGLLFLAAGEIVAGLIASALLRLTRAWAYEFVPPDLTLGAVAHYAVAYGSPILGDLAQPATRGQTLEVVQSLARLEIGAASVHPDATWEQLAHLARAS